MEQKERKLNLEKPEHQKLFSAELVAVSGLSIIAVLGFARITNRLIKNNLNPFRTDVKVMNYLSNIESPGLTKFMKFITSLASVEVIPFLASTWTFLFVKSKNNRSQSFDIPVIAIGSEVLNLLFKARFKRNRPVQNAIRVSGWSYPSGHAMESMSFYGLMIYSLLKSNKLPKWLVYGGSVSLAGLIVLIGISRSYLKVHYPSDVVAGYSLGLLWLVSSITLIRGGEKLFKKTVVNGEGLATA